MPTSNDLTYTPPLLLSEGSSSGRGSSSVTKREMRWRRRQCCKTQKTSRIHDVFPTGISPKGFDGDNSILPGGVSLDPPLERGPHFGGDLTREIEVIDVSDSSSEEENTLPKVTKISMASYLRPNFNLTEAVISSRNAEYCFKRHEAIRLASRYWKAAGIPAQKAWNARAVLLNTLSPAGVFISRPPGIKNFVSLALRSLTFELDALRSMARSSLLRRPKRKVSELTRSFGPERVHIATQYFRSFPFSLLLQEVIFGRNFSKLQKKELVVNKKATVIMHFHSAKRLQEIFSVRDTCMVSELKDHGRYWACPKVFLSNNTFGYVVNDEFRKGRLQVHTQNNVVIDINCSFSVSPNLAYTFCDSRVIKYWPVRVMLKNKRIFFTYSRAVFSESTGDLLRGLCS